jgi:hypothetical protein
MKKTTVKKIFIFFLFFLPLQYATVGIVGLIASEPWPALVLPAFQNVDATPANISVQKPVLSIIDVKDNTHSNVKPDKLFKGIQESQLQGFLRTHFGDSLKWTQKGKNSKVWLLNQISQNYPSIEPKFLKIRWEKMHYNFSSSPQKTDSTQLAQEFSISLND